MAEEARVQKLVKRKKTQGEEIDELMTYIEQGGSLGMEMEKKLEDMPEKYVVLLVIGHDKYDLLIANLVKNFVKKGFSGIFVALNKSSEDLVAMLEKNGVDCTNLFVVDAVSKKESRPKPNKNVSYIDSPQDLTELEAQIIDFAKTMQPGKSFLVVDSLSTLLVYNAEKTVERFVHGLGEKMKELDFKNVFTIRSKTKPETMDVLMQFCDKVVRSGPKINP